MVDFYGKCRYKYHIPYMDPMGRSSVCGQELGWRNMAANSDPAVASLAISLTPQSSCELGFDVVQLHGNPLKP